MLQCLDDFLLDRVFQPAADWVQGRFERGTFWLAAACLHAVAGTIIASSAMLMAHDDHSFVIAYVATLTNAAPEYKAQGE